jgi:hypothetical protein
LQFGPEVRVYWDSSPHVFFAELEDLFAGVADGLCSFGAGGCVQIFEDAVGYVGEFGGVGYVGGVDG